MMNKWRIRPANHVYRLLRPYLIQNYGLAISLLVEYSNTEQGMLEYIDDRKADIRGEFDEIEKSNLPSCIMIRLMGEMIDEYTKLSRAKKTLLKNKEKPSTTT